eukprot:Gb_32174 [translate_table: standard]
MGHNSGIRAINSATVDIGLDSLTDKKQQRVRNSPLEEGYALPRRYSQREMSGSQDFERDEMDVMARIHKLKQFFDRNPRIKFRDKKKSEGEMVVKKLCEDDIDDNDHLSSMVWLREATCYAAPQKNLVLAFALAASNLKILLNNPAANDNMWKGPYGENLLQSKKHDPEVGPMVIDTRVCYLRVPTLGTMAVSMIVVDSNILDLDMYRNLEKKGLVRKSNCLEGHYISGSRSRSKAEEKQGYIPCSCKFRSNLRSNTFFWECGIGCIILVSLSEEFSLQSHFDEGNWNVGSSFPSLPREAVGVIVMPQHRRCTNFYDTSEDATTKLVHQSWETTIEAWQVIGGTIWTYGAPLVWKTKPNMKDSWKRASKRENKAESGEDVGRFLYFEGVDMQWEFAKAVLIEDNTKIKFLAEENSGIRKVCRDLVATSDKSFGRDAWLAVCAAMEYMERFDKGGDCLIENDGFSDQTYDTWTV